MNCLLQLKDYSLLERACRNFEKRSGHLLLDFSGLGRIYLQIGAVPSAKRVFLEGISCCLDQLAKSKIDIKKIDIEKLDAVKTLNIPSADLPIVLMNRWVLAYIRVISHKYTYIHIFMIQRVSVHCKQ